MVKLMMIFMVVVVVLIFALHIITNLDGDEVDEDSYGGCGVELKKHIYSLSQSDKSFPKRIGPLTQTKPKPPGL